MAAPYPQVVLFGDSLFQGACNPDRGFSFQNALQAHCMRRYDVINRGMSGYNTSQALKILAELFPPPSPSGPKLEYLLVLLGANDAALPKSADSQHVDLGEYKENLIKIIAHPNIKAHNPKILLITPPPLDEILITELDKEIGFATRQAEISASYAEAARNVALKTPGVILIDLWKALMDEAIAKTPGFDASAGMLGDPASGKRGYLEQLLPDGLHLSAEAYEIFYKAVEPHIKPEHPHTTTEGFVFPEWRTAPWMEKE